MLQPRGHAAPRRTLVPTIEEMVNLAVIAICGTSIIASGLQSAYSDCQCAVSLAKGYSLVSMIVSACVCEPPFAIDQETASDPWTLALNNGRMGDGCFPRYDV